MKTKLQLNEEIEDLKTQIEELQEQIEDQRDEISDLESGHEEMEEKLEDINTLESEIEDMKNLWTHPKTLHDQDKLDILQRLFNNFNLSELTEIEMEFKKLKTIYNDFI